MKRRLAFVIFLAGAILTVTSTGAFTTTSAERSADVSVAGDANALVQLTPYTDASGQRSELASIVGGELEISINANAETDAENVFNVTNQGTQPVAVWISDVDAPNDLGGVTDGNNTDEITFYNPRYGGAESTENGVASVEGRENAVELTPGETLVVSIYIDTTDVGSDEADLLDAMIVHASAEVDGVSSPTNGDDSDDDNGPPWGDDDGPPWTDNDDDDNGPPRENNDDDDDGDDDDE